MVFLVQTCPPFALTSYRHRSPHRVSHAPHRVGRTPRHLLPSPTYGSHSPPHGLLQERPLVNTSESPLQHGDVSVLSLAPRRHTTPAPCHRVSPLLEHEDVSALIPAPCHHHHHHLIPLLLTTESRSTPRASTRRIRIRTALYSVRT
jgi:hypothetical protein